MKIAVLSRWNTGCGTGGMGAVKTCERDLS